MNIGVCAYASNHATVQGGGEKIRMMFPVLTLTKLPKAIYLANFTSASSLDDHHNSCMEWYSLSPQAAQNTEAAKWLSHMFKVICFSHLSDLNPKNSCLLQSMHPPFLHLQPRWLEDQPRVIRFSGEDRHKHK